MMDKKIAAALLESLAQRLRSDPRLRDSVSSLEAQALEVALRELELPGTAAPSERVEPVVREVGPAPELILRSLERGAPENPEVTLCIDFGTAMSKACAISDRDVLKVMDLQLGRVAGEDERYPYSVSSALWISNDERLFFGPDAVRGSVHGGAALYSSLKREMSLNLEARDLSNAELPQGINPTRFTFSVGDLLGMYFAYLTDLAVTELEVRFDVSPYVRRRFAVPVWRPQKWAGLKPQLRDLLARAVILRDTFRGRWKEGIPLSHLRKALDDLKPVADEGRLPGFLIERPVLEPVAAGASRVDATLANRGLIMVVDVGAGTTDFALFVIISKDDGEFFKVFPVKDGADALPQAGDEIDGILGQLILERESIEARPGQNPLVQTELSLQIRRLKETLFEEGSVRYSLSNRPPGTIELADLLEHDVVKRFGEELQRRFQGVLERMHPSLLEGYGQKPLTVCLTGGGAGLPMVRALANGPVVVHGRTLERTLGDDIPWFVQHRCDPATQKAYPLLAVALGGASGYLPEEGITIERYLGMRG